MECRASSSLHINTELKDEQGKVTELTGCEVGFRTSEIKDGRFCINGVPVLVKGTNRHEHSQLGRTVSKEPDGTGHQTDEAAQYQHGA